jgi:aspartate kinase
MFDQKIVAKFGGSSMADAQAMLRSAQISKEHQAAVVLVSATYGTTDKLVSLCESSQKGDWKSCENSLFAIKEKHLNLASELSISDQDKNILDSLLDELETLAKGMHLLNECSLNARDKVLSLGERMSSLLFSEALRKTVTDKKVIYFDVRKVMLTDAQHGKATPLLGGIKKLCQQHMPIIDNTIYVTQGFIGQTHDGHTTTLGRGGSDYSASLLAEAIDADLLEIWTDVAGIASTDPRICKEAKAINEISYREASEMAQYGAKVLHPTTLAPAIRGNIPVFVGSSYDKDKPGTWIRETTQNMPTIRAITKRSNQGLMIIRTPEMLNAWGFMGKIFEVFRKNRISVDCVTTSEISVAISVDHTTLENQELLADLRELGEVIMEKNYSLLSLIGNKIHQTPGIGKSIFTALGDINVRMVCLGASDHNFCFIVDDDKADLAINRLHQFFIEESNESRITG